jgi:hypothetical protein
MRSMARFCYRSAWNLVPLDATFRSELVFPAMGFPGEGEAAALC